MNTCFPKMVLFFAIFIIGLNGDEYCSRESIHCFPEDENNDGIPDLTLQELIDDESVVVGDTIIVFPGDYFVNLEITKKLTLASKFLFPDEAHLEDPEFYIERTVLDGSQIERGYGRGSVAGFIGSGMGVGRDEDEDCDIRSALIGFTIQNGMGTEIRCPEDGCQEMQRVGGGFMAIGTVPDIKHNHFINNGENEERGYSRGGFGGAGFIGSGMGVGRCVYEDANLSNNTFINNKAKVGKSIVVRDLELEVNMHNSHFDVYNEDEEEISDYWVTSDIANYDFTGSEGIVNVLTSEIHVSPVGNDNNEGSELYPFKTINKALEVAFGDSAESITINLESGVYSPSTNGEFYPIQLIDHVTLSGAGMGLSVLDAELTSQGMIIENNRGVTIENMTIRRGNGEHGGGVMIKNSLDIELRNINVRDNISFWSGAGIYIEGSDPDISNIRVFNNTTPESDGHGAGITFKNSNGTLKRSLLFSNNAVTIGGGILCQHSNPLIQNVTITENFASTGGGIAIVEDSAPMIINSIIWQNGPSEVFIPQGNLVNIAYSDLKGGSAGIDSNDPQNTYTLEEVINEPPLFVNPDVNNYYLNIDSPGLNTGSPIFSDSETIDIPEMGAFEFNPDLGGCTEPNANNYNPAATFNDGSCTYHFSPLGLVASVSNSQVVLTWLDPSESVGDGLPGESDGDYFDCDGVGFDLVYLEWLGDGLCDEGEWGIDFNCDTWNFDEGDCADAGNCPEGTIDDCVGLDGGSLGWCAPEAWLGDGYCDDGEYGFDLTCFENDGGDCDIEEGYSCLDQGLNEDCVGTCFSDEYLIWVGDGYCDDGIYGLVFTCDEWNNDGGDCDSEGGCPAGTIPDCSGTDGGSEGDCAPEAWLGDGLCDDGSYGFDLTCYENDNGDCNSELYIGMDCCDFIDCENPDNFSYYGTILDCDLSNCVPESWLGDGYCDNGIYWDGNLYCEELNYDEGDCDGGDYINPDELTLSIKENYLVLNIPRIRITPKSFNKDFQSWVAVNLNKNHINSKIAPHNPNWNISRDYTDPLTYNIYRSDIAGGNYSSYATVDSDQLTFIDSDVIEGISYYYLVTALYESGESGFSNYSSALVPLLGCTDNAATNFNPLATINNGDCEYYYVPTELTASGIENGIQLNWNKPTGFCFAQGLLEDCSGNCFEEAYLSWEGDDWCDCTGDSCPEGQYGYGLDFMCEEFNFDGGDCFDNDEFECPPGTIFDCAGIEGGSNSDCAPEEWLGDGWCDNGTWGYDLTCYEEESSDCEELSCEDQELLEDCGGTCFANEDCIDDYYDGCIEGETTWLGDGICDDGSFGLNFNCEEYNYDLGDCEGDLVSYFEKRFNRSDKKQPKNIFNLATSVNMKLYNKILYEYEMTEYEVLDRENDGLSGFSIFRSVEYSEYFQIGSTDSRTTSYIDTDEVEDGVYTYAIVALYGDSNSSEQSDPVTIIIGGSETMSLDLHSGANLVSFYILPDDNSIENVLNDASDNINGIIGEGVASTQLSPGNWIGSLTHIDRNNGYWLKLNNDGELNVSGNPTDPNILYNLHSGANLISFPSELNIDIGIAIPDDVENIFEGLIGEGVASTQLSPGNWIGSLIQFQGGKGYWAKVSEDVSYSFNISDGLAMVKNPSIIPYPNDFEYIQSTEQAFYFINEIIIDGNSDIEENWILAYCNEKIVGSRKWRGMNTDVPAMGDDGSNETLGYCKSGETPNFKLLNEDTGEIFSLIGEIQQWQNNEIYIVSTLNGTTTEIPREFHLGLAYPNPFNPATNILFDIPKRSHIVLVVYDLMGREVVRLVDNSMAPGFHKIVWDGKNNSGAPMSSGIYIYHLNTPEYSCARKLMLIK